MSTSIFGVVNWHNLSDTSCPGATNNGIQDGVQAAPVIDEDIDIIGVNALVNGVHVTAQAADIAINVSADSVLTGSGSRCDGVATNPAELYLSIAAGRTITFNINNDLTFRGASNGTTALDLLVTVTGGGTVLFSLADTTTVSLISTATTQGGVQFYLASDGTNNPTMHVTRQNTNSAEDATFLIGARSKVSILSNSASGQGTFEFDGTNLGDGQLRLVIEDRGALATVSHEITTLNDPVLADIDLTTQLGQANFSLESPTVGGASGVLQVVNSNTIFPELHFNPLCETIPTGTQYGFIVGPNAIFTVNDLSYLDYIGTASNECTAADSVTSCTRVVQRLRNGSAFIIDGGDCASTTTINLLGESAIYFRSGVDACGTVTGGYTVNPILRTPGMGNIVFDIEGQADIIGALSGGAVQSGINILSLQVQKTGCPVLVEGSSTLFPKRTFARDSNGDYLAYNSGAMLVNGRVNIIDTVLIHTDENHSVYSTCCPVDCISGSGPTYVGGDSYSLCKNSDRPAIKFINGQFRVHTDVASTGVDFLVGYNPSGTNNSDIIFYNNGRCIDKGYGRNWVLGTEPTLLGCCYTTTDNDSHLNVLQDEPGAASSIQLNLTTGTNTDCITEGIPANTALIAGQDAVQTIFLNNASNITIGNLNGVGYSSCTGAFVATTPSELLIAGSCFSFETAGGCVGDPALGGTTGQGAMFVDSFGTVAVANSNIVNFGMMVVRSGTGVVDLPQRSVFFDSEVGITNWNVNLTDPNEVVIVAPGQNISDFTLDWGAITKNYCCINTQTGCFIPYDLGHTPTNCICPPVTDQNLTSIPTVEGTVDQFQILHSRICDQVHLMVNGGTIKELIFLPGCESGEAAVGFFALENYGTLGLGSAERNYDSNDAHIKLGINGVMVCANGDGCVNLNENILIDNDCHILSGTAFGVNGENRLRISSEVPTELRIKSTGSLDLSQFDTANKVLEIGGKVKLICEPGARIIMNGGILAFTDDATFQLERTCNLGAWAGSVPSDTDAIRVRMSGTGSVVMNSAASMIIPQGAGFGIETYPTCATTTNITWLIQDQAVLYVGNDDMPGGIFQIGNTTNIPGASITFNFILDGIGALLQVDRQGFLGLGAGIVDKSSTIPNNWIEATLANVTSITISILQGTIRHDQIVTGNSSLGSLWAIGSAGTYTFNFALPTSVIRAGGNLAQLTSAALSPVNVVIDTTSGLVGSTNVGIMAGRYLLLDPSKGAQPVGVAPATLFNYLKTDNYEVPNYPKGNATSEQLNVMTVGYVRGAVGPSGNTIRRIDFQQGLLLGLNGFPVDIENSVNIGAVALTIDTTSNDEALPIEIMGAGVQ